MRTPVTRPTIGPVSLRNVPTWVVKGRGHRTSFEHDLAQERARRWIASGPFRST